MSITRLGLTNLSALPEWKLLYERERGLLGA